MREWDLLVRSCLLTAHRAPLCQPSAKQAAIFLPLLVDDDTSIANSKVLFLVKAKEGLKEHAGETCFPGGRVQPDESIMQAALREAKEELAIDPGCWRVVGPLGTFPNRVSNWIVHPILACLPINASFVPDGREIERCFTLPIKDLMTPTSMVDTGRRGWPLMPVYELRGERVWGMTAYILHAWIRSLTEARAL